MYIYSEYHDEFFTFEGHARDAVNDPMLLRKIVEKYMPVEKLVDMHIGVEVEIEGVYAVEVWVILSDGITSLILADSPIPLTPKQWQIVINKVDEQYRRVRGLLIEPKPNVSFKDLMEDLENCINTLGLKLKFLAKMSKAFLSRSLNLIGLRPWNIVLALSKDHIVETYLIPRRFLKDVEEWFKGKAKITYV